MVPPYGPFCLWLPTIWPALLVRLYTLQLEQHWLPKDLFELLRQGLQLLFQDDIFAQLGLDTTKGSSWCSGAGQGWGGASFVQVVLHISMIHRTDRTVFQLKKTSSLPKDPICWWIVPVCWWIVSRWIPSATAGGKRFEPCVGSPARPSWNACRGPWLVLKLLWEMSSVSSWKKY